MSSKRNCVVCGTEFSSKGRRVICDRCLVMMKAQDSLNNLEKYVAEQLETCHELSKQHLSAEKALYMGQALAYQNILTRLRKQNGKTF